MNRNEYRKNAYDMLHLAASIINGKKPSAKRLQQMDLDAVFEIAQAHSLTAICAYALESCGMDRQDFSEAKDKSIRRDVLMDSDRDTLFSAFEEEHIWHMPLKGILLKNIYPRLGMRQMADNDILIDPEYRERVRVILEGMGYTCEKFGSGISDLYFKEPSCSFKIYSGLVSENAGECISSYYKHIMEKLILRPGTDCEYEFGINDYYIYMTVNEFLHYSGGGTGLRSLLDAYVFLCKFSDRMDREYIGAELKKLGAADYDNMRSYLALTLFRYGGLNLEDKKVLDYYIFSGVYGNVENAISNGIGHKNRGSKLGYVLHRVFPGMNWVREYYPFFYRNKIFLPLLPPYRFLKGLIFNRRKLIYEMNVLLHGKFEKVSKWQ